MTIHRFAQYSEDWWRTRTGVITASEVGPFVVNSGAVAAKARRKLIAKKLAELAGEVEEAFPNDAMKRGTALEPFARAEYSRMFSVEVEEVGFVSHDQLKLGCSPDGLVMDGETIVRGLEIKCPSPTTHTLWLLDGDLPEEHKWQVHMSMAIAGADCWDFFSYCPRASFIKTRDAWHVDQLEAGSIPPLHVRVHRSAFTEELLRGLSELCIEYSAAKASMAVRLNEYLTQNAA